MKPNCRIVVLSLFLTGLSPLGVVAQITGPLLPYAVPPSLPQLPLPPEAEPSFPGQTVISRLRPDWLRAQPTGSVSGGVVRSQSILVYLNRQRLEDLNALKTISVGGIESAEWVDASRVQTVLSEVPSGAIAGAIVIRTR